MNLSLLFYIFIRRATGDRAFERSFCNAKLNVGTTYNLKLFDWVFQAVRQEHFTYTTTQSVIMGGNQAEGRRNPRLAAGCFLNFPTNDRRKGWHELDLNS